MDDVFLRSQLVSGEANHRYEYLERKKAIQHEVERIVQECKRGILATCRKQPQGYQQRQNTKPEYVYKLPHENRYLNSSPIYPTSAIPSHLPSTLSLSSAEVLPRVLETLKRMFPDTKIQVDPMKTYIHFDWSIPPNLDVD